jgi:hypothetical protein
VPATYYKLKQMPSTYELMEAYRSWCRSSYGTTPNSQATIVAAAWARDVLAAYIAGTEPAEAS